MAKHDYGLRGPDPRVLISRRTVGRIGRDIHGHGIRAVGLCKGTARMASRLS